MQTSRSTEISSWWDRGVALGAAGYLCAADAALPRSTAGARPAGDPLASLVASTRASWIRQAGRHRAALSLDGVAVTLAVTAVDADPSAVAVAALGDALVGLAADNLGIGRFRTAQRLLDRVEADVLPAVDPAESFLWGSRVELRWRWVSTELALYGGDPVAAAARSAAAVAVAQRVPSDRHRIKTELIAAAAAAANGETDDARRLAASVEQRCAQHGLLPLRWAALTMLAGLSADDAAQARDLGRDIAAVVAELANRGMYL